MPELVREEVAKLLVLREITLVFFLIAAGGPRGSIRRRECGGGRGRLGDEGLWRPSGRGFGRGGGRVALGVDRIMASPSGETTWARHAPLPCFGGGRDAVGRRRGGSNPPPRASSVVRSASMAKRVWGCSRKATGRCGCRRRGLRPARGWRDIQGRGFRGPERPGRGRGRCLRDRSVGGRTRCA